MSAGNSLRRGYYAAPARSTEHEAVGLGERFTLVLAGALVMMFVALLSNDVVAAAVVRVLGTAWAEISRFVLHLLSGGAA
jgi:hypothetical protein